MSASLIGRLRSSTFRLSADFQLSPWSQKRGPFQCMPRDCSQSRMRSRARGPLATMLNGLGDRCDAVLAQLGFVLQHTRWPPTDGLGVSERGNHPLLYCCSVFASKPRKFIRVLSGLKVSWPLNAMTRCSWMHTGLRERIPHRSSARGVWKITRRTTTCSATQQCRSPR